jgi:cellulose synthase/poly-beta-1,6-N-acetylglucosamine synthase-like glycosyltransferase
LVFTDANTMFRADALRKLVRHFVDPGIGGVCGRLVFVKPGEENPEAEGAYWGFETKLKTWESSLDSCLGANGAVYAIRPELFWNALPPNTVVDDFVIGMKVREKGYRMVYDPTAVAEEELPEQRAEWKRRVRIGSGDYQAISFCRRCLHPSYGWLAWAFWSHKVLRWFTPHLMLLAAIAAVIGSVIALLTDQPAPLSHLVSAGALIMLSLWGVARILSSVRPSISGLRLPCTAHRAKERPPTSDFRLPAVGALLRLLDHFLTMQAALLAGFFRYLGGGMSGTWVRTPR